MGIFSNFANSLHKQAEKIADEQNKVDKMSIEELAYEIERYGFTSEYHSSMYKRLNNNTQNISNLIDYLTDNGYESGKCVNRYYKIFQNNGFFCKQDKKGVYHLNSNNIR